MSVKAESPPGIQAPSKEGQRMLRQVSKNVDSVRIPGPIHHYFAHFHCFTHRNIGNMTLCVNM